MPGIVKKFIHTSKNKDNNCCYGNYSVGVKLPKDHLLAMVLKPLKVFIAFIFWFLTYHYVCVYRTDKESGAEHTVSPE